MYLITPYVFVYVKHLKILLFFLLRDPDNLFPSFEEEEEEVESDSPDIMLPNEFGEMER